MTKSKLEKLADFSMKGSACIAGLSGFVVIISKLSFSAEVLGMIGCIFAGVLLVIGVMLGCMDEKQKKKIAPNPKYEIGNFVRIVDHAHCRNCAISFFDLYLPERVCNFKMGFMPMNGEWGKILKIFKQDEDFFSYFIELSLDYVVIVDEDGIRSINDETLALLKKREESRVHSVKNT